jgi:prolyl 4-hydroxylase
VLSISTSAVTMKWWLYLWLTLVTIPVISGELFTALVHLEKLLNTEKQIVGSLEEYITSEEQRLSQLRQLSRHYNELHVIASKDTASYLANPINAYLLVKRLTTDWREVETLIHTDKRHLIDVLQQNETFPSAEDLSGLQRFSTLFVYISHVLISFARN